MLAEVEDESRLARRKPADGPDVQPDGTIRPPLLRYIGAEPTNLAEFRKHLIPWFESRFGDFGTFVRTNTHYEPPEVPQPPVPENETSEQKVTRLARLREQLRRRDLDAYKLRGKWTKVHAELWSLISESSQAAVRAHERFEDLEKTRDPLLLWSLICSTHAGVQSGSATADAVAALRAYHSMRQGQKETTDSFKERFDAAVAAIHATGAECPSQAMQACHFIDGLDDSRYAELKSRIHNNEVAGIQARPSKLLDAHRIATKYMTVTTQGGTVTGVSFVANVSHGEKPRGKRAREDALDKAKDGKSRDKPPAADRPPKRGRNDTKPKKSGPSGPCKLCGKAGHWTNLCPDLERAKKLIGSSAPSEMAAPAIHDDDNSAEATVFFGDVAFVAKSSFAPREVILDNAATASIFNCGDLLTDIRDAERPIVVKGVGGTLRVNQVGDFGKFGSVYFAPLAPVNLLSFGKVAESHRVVYDSTENQFVVEDGDGLKAEFAAKRLGEHNAPVYTHVFHTETVHDREARYTKRQVADAQAARNLMKALGYPSTSDMIDMLTTGKVVNTKITAHDLRRALDIYGPDLSSLKGKTTQRRGVIVRVEPVCKPSETEQTLHADVMFVAGEAFFIVVAKPLAYTMVRHLANGRNASMLGEALTGVVSELQTHGFTASTLLTDGEGGLIKSRDVIDKLGLKLNPTGPAQHVPVVERKIRTVKERMRAILSGLPFNLPVNLLSYLVQYAVTKVNMAPSCLRPDKASPRELFSGRKVDARTDLHVAFGDYAQCKAPYVQSNAMDSRTEAAIALGPTGNLQGSARFFLLTTHKVVTRDRWTPLPCPDSVVAHMNALCAVGKRGGVAKDPIVSRGRVEILATEAPDINVPTPAMTTPDPSRHPSDPTPAAQEEVRLFNDAAPAFSPEPANETTPPSMQQTAASRLLPDATPHMPEEPSLLNDMAPVPSQVPGANEAVVQATETPSSATQATAQVDHATPARRYPLRDRSGAHRAYHLTVKQAATQFGHATEDAVAAEIQQMLDLKVWEPVRFGSLTAEQRASTIWSSIFLKEKKRADGSFDKLKARLVASGNQQDRSLYESVSSPTVTLTHVLLGAGIAAEERRRVCTADIVGAYLKVPMSGPAVHVRLPAFVANVLCTLRPELQPLRLKDGTIVVKLLKAMYGCVESSKLLFQRIQTTLQAAGFKPNPHDECVLNHGQGATQCTIHLYVDDLLITSRDEAAITSVLDTLAAVFGPIKATHGPRHDYLGMTLDFSTPGECRLAMEGFVQELLEGCDARCYSTPAASYLHEFRASSPLLPASEARQFHTNVAKLLYLAKRTRPDVLLVASFLATRVREATEDDEKKLARALGYLRGTADFALTLRFRGVEKVEAFVDASYAIHADKKSQTGGLFSAGGGCFGATSSKQKIVAKSSTEAELIAASDFSGEIISLKAFLKEQGYEVKPITVWQDNMSTLTLIARGGQASKRSKHIDVRYFYLKDRVAIGDLLFQHKPAGQMTADILTKPLSGELFKTLRRKLLGMEK